MTSRYDCTACGACCWTYSRRDGYTPLTPRDIARLQPAMVVQSRHHGLPVLKLQPRHGGVACVALRGTIGESVRCSIYTDRPQFCRAFTPGSAACREARRRAGVG